jgi:hypothetical protein
MLPASPRIDLMADDDRAYIDNLKDQYRAAMSVPAGTPQIYWNLWDPTEEEQTRHGRLVAVAEQELGIASEGWKP